MKVAKTYSWSYILTIAFTGLMLTLHSCSSSKKSTHRPSYQHSQSKKPSTSQEISTKDMTPSEKTLISEAQNWLGTPYKYGGNTKSGIDCSGFIYNVFNDSFDIKLPRNSAKQAEYCDNVNRDKLTPGDLVFFATNKSNRDVSHVGIYVGDEKMIHASTSRGVIVSDLNQNYYANAYVGAGRVSDFASLNKKNARKGKTSKRNNETPADNSTTPAKRQPMPSVPITVPVPVTPEIENAPVEVIGKEQVMASVNVSNLNKVLGSKAPTEESIDVNPLMSDAFDISSTTVDNSYGKDQVVEVTVEESSDKQQTNNILTVSSKQVNPIRIQTSASRKAEVKETVSNPSQSISDSRNRVLSNLPDLK